MKSRARALLPLLALLLPATAVAAEPPSADAYATFAQLAADRHDYPTAEKALREGMAAYPDHPGFHLLLGAVLGQERRFDESFDELQWEVLRSGLSRREGRTAAQLAAIVAANAGPGSEPQAILDAIGTADPARAKKKLEALSDSRFSVIAIEADDAWLAGDVAAAEKLYRATLVRDPRYVPALCGLARIAKSRGDAKRAAELVQSAKSIDAARTAEVWP